MTPPDVFPPPGGMISEVLDRIDEGVCALDRALTVTYANGSAERILGVTRADLLGRRFDAVLPEFVDDALSQAFAAALAGEVRRLARPPDPAGRAVEVAVEPNRGGLWLFLRDASAREAMAAQLRERDDLLTMAEDAAGIGVWEIDLATGMVRGTPQFWRLMGLPETDRAVPIETTRNLRLPEDRERVARGFQSVMGNHADTFEMEYRIRRPDGEVRWIFGRGRLIRDGRGRPLRYSGIDIDVSERKAAEAVLADLNQALEQRVRERTQALEAETSRRARAEALLHQAQKMETIGQLTGGIAHDFNNLLTVISGNIEAVQRRLPTGETRLRELAEAAIRGTERAATLTGRLLAFARRQALEPKLIDVNGLVLGMADLLHRTLGEVVSVRMALGDNLPAVFVDPNQLESAILNLAVNSRDAMPDGGTLSIETGLAAVAPAAGLAEADADPGPYLRIAVSDTGTGMARHIRDMAFEPFFTTKEPGEGTGLGLPQVYGFIKQSGGFCRLDSTPGSGTTVTLYLPVAERAAQPVAAAGTTSAGLAAGFGEAILVTEDDPEVRAFSADLLRELGYRVMTAGDAAAALAVLERDPSIRLLFTDLGLPGPLNGRQLAETARARHPDLKVLLTTGYSADAIARRGWLDPGMELIAKPFTSAALSGAIRRILEGSADAG